MMMKPPLRRLMLTVHLVSSVAWFGAAAAYAALVGSAIASVDFQRVQAAYLAIEPLMWLAIVPLAFASLISGLIQSLGTPWGLMRHYWVIYKLALTVIVTTILLLNTQTVGALAHDATAESADLAGLKGQLLHAGLGMLALLVITVLGVYKPRGMTRYGWRKQRERESLLTTGVH